MLYCLCGNRDTYVRYGSHIAHHILIMSPFSPTVSSTKLWQILPQTVSRSHWHFEDLSALFWAVLRGKVNVISYFLKN